ncbi:hypothetical protein AAHA92_10860 [Salvia divinorum]|uniref:NAC domain-containing protein n=1 Tax=Salvia divinorum TaxID=28513 RepID=A0ABD1HYP4_SALDI
MFALGFQVSRRAGTGTWGGQTGPKKIKDSNNSQIIGHSKMFTFEHSISEEDLGHWTMHEYSLIDELVRKSGRSNVVDLMMSKITKTVKKKKYDGTHASQPLAELARLLLAANDKKSS